PPDPQRAPATSQNRRRLALGTSDHHRLETDHSLAPSPLTARNPSRRPQKDPGERGTPGRPARQPGHRPAPTLKSRSTTLPGGCPRPATGQRESSGLVPRVNLLGAASHVIYTV